MKNKAKRSEWEKLFYSTANHKKIKFSKDKKENNNERKK